MICEKVQPFKVQLLQSDRTSEFAAIAPKTRSLKISAAGTAIGTLLILLALPVEAVNLTLPEPSNMAAMIVAGLGLLAVKIKRRSLLVK